MPSVQDSASFVAEFLQEYFVRGFGTMGKRDIDILVMHLLVKHGFFGDELDYFLASRQLKISEVRVRNLHKDVQLRYAQYTEDQAKNMFVGLIDTLRFEVSATGSYTFIVRDPLLRQFFEEWVARVNGFNDSSFNPNLVVISRRVLLDVLDYLTTGDNLETIKARLPETIDDEVTAETTKKGLFSRFLEKYVDTLGEETARATVQAAGLGLRALLGIPG